MPLHVLGRTFTWSAQRAVTGFTPWAVLLLVLVANSEAINLQKHDPDVMPWLSIPIVLIGVIGSADCLVRMADVPAARARWSRLANVPLAGRPFRAVNGRRDATLVTPVSPAPIYGLVTFVVVTLVLSSAFFGPFTFGLVRWAAIVIGVPWTFMLWLTVRELVRIVRRPSSPAPSPETMSAG